MISELEDPAKRNEEWFVPGMFVLQSRHTKPKLFNQDNCYCINQHYYIKYYQINVTIVAKDKDWKQSYNGQKHIKQCNCKTSVIHLYSQAKCFHKIVGSCAKYYSVICLAVSVHFCFILSCIFSCSKIHLYCASAK